MNCPKCNREIPDRANFCPVCGASTEGHPEPEGKRPGISRKWLVPGVIILVLILSTTFILSSLFLSTPVHPSSSTVISAEEEKAASLLKQGQDAMDNAWEAIRNQLTSSAAKKNEGNHKFLRYKADLAVMMKGYDTSLDLENYQLAYNGRLVPEFEIKGRYSTQTNMDGTVYVIEDTQGVYLITSEGVTNVSGTTSGCQLSGAGNAIAYTDAMGALFLYQNEEDETIPLSPTTSGTRASYAVSPSGDSVAYITEDSELCVFDCQTQETRDIDCTITGSLIGISDSAKSIFYTQADGGLFVVSNDVSETLSTDLPQVSSLYLNYNHTQILFTEEERPPSLFIEGTGQMLLPLPSRNLLPILPKGVYRSQFMVENDSQNQFVTTYGVNSFTDLFIATRYSDEALDKNLYYLKHDGTVAIVDIGIYEYKLNQTGDVLVFSTGDDGGTLYKVTAEDMKLPQVIDYALSDGRLIPFTLTSDGAHIYYINAAGELWHYEEMHGPEKIADDVDSLSLCLAADDSLLYITGRGLSLSPLCRHTGAGGAEVITKGVRSVHQAASGIYYSVDVPQQDKLDVYYSENGADFRPVAKGIQYLTMAH